MGNLANAKLTGSDFTGAQFIGGTSRGARFHRAKLVKTFFLGHDLTGVQFNGSHLARAKFIQCALKGAHLYSETLTDVDFIMSRPWSSLLFWPSASPSPSAQAFDEREISGINDLLDRCREFRETHGEEVVLYFRGENRHFPELRPSVMRNPGEGETRLRSAEGEMLDDLMTRQPEAFNRLATFGDQRVEVRRDGITDAHGTRLDTVADANHILDEIGPLGPDSY